MLLGHMQLTRLVQVLAIAWNIVVFLCSHYIVKCPTFQVPLTVMCIYRYQSLSHQCSVPTLECGGVCELFYESVYYFLRILP